MRNGNFVESSWTMLIQIIYRTSPTPHISSLVNLVMTGKYGSLFSRPARKLTAASKWLPLSVILRVWKADSNSNSKITEELIASYISSKSRSRNARLALLKYHSSDFPVHGGTQEKLLSASLEYFLEYHSKVICFNDLQPYVLGLSKPLQERFLRLVAERTESLNHDKNYVVRHLWGLASWHADHSK